jgi:hypothetical protein
MDINFIESKFNEIISELENEVMEILSDQSLDKKLTNLNMKPISSVRQILENALDSIRMVNRLSKEEINKAVEE